MAPSSQSLERAGDVTEVHAVTPGRAVRTLQAGDSGGVALGVNLGEGDDDDMGAEDAAIYGRKRI
jgi:hypothetical protein